MLGACKVSDTRLFVPLSRAPFEWFKSGEKHWELRRYGRQYTEAHLRVGRRVELRHGYGSRNDALWGTLQESLRANSIEEFFDAVPYDRVIPAAESRSDAVFIARKILGSVVEVIGFRVVVDDD
jgi:hypothetical protein